MPKSAELMQALNLMLSETPQLFFIIGMDREKVAAGLAVKYEKLIPYLNPASVSNAPGANPGLEYGFEFIEKFIQVPFKIPSPNADNIGNLIAELSIGREAGNNSGDDIKKSRNGAESFGGIYGTLKDDLIEAKNDFNKDIEIARKKYIEDTGQTPKSSRPPDSPKKEDVDSEEIGEVIKTVAPFFDFNPRRIKQFLNIFRLKIYIGNETGLFNAPAPHSPFKRINLHKLGKFVAVSLRYPLLINNLDETPELLTQLQNNALGHKKFKNDNIPYWANKKRLNKLLYANIGKPSAKLSAETKKNLDKYGLHDLDITKLLLISPSIKTTAPTNVQQKVQESSSSVNEEAALPEDEVSEMQ